MPKPTDVVATWTLPGSNGSKYVNLLANGSLDSYGITVGQLTYVACANDGTRYHFGPNGDRATFTYDGLPAATRVGTRYFVTMQVLGYNGTSYDVVAA